MWYLYILECRDGKLYTGITDNLERRFKEHFSGKGGHYTKYSSPQKIIYKETFNSRVMAEDREIQVKGWSQAKKLALISGDFEKLKKLSVSRD